MVDTAFEPLVDSYVDDEGRRFDYVHIVHPGSHGLGIHFSAFFGAWGERKGFQEFRGYFHRLKMLGSDQSKDWLFLCDPYGAFDNGTYYTGRAGDLFVERATRRIIDDVIDRGDYEPRDVVTIGSSMGATAALKFGVDLGAAGIVAIGPHIDLDISAAEQNRMDEVAWICPDGDALAPHNHVLTRQVRNAVANAAPTTLPTLFIQSCADDHGVHEEQVVPLVREWSANGSTVETDIRPSGGHTSDFATRAVLLDATDRIIAGTPLEPKRYRTEKRFRPAPKALRVRATDRLRRLKRRLAA